ncbi:MAG: hypothetical protein HYU28_02250 [Actinobacteria bacterium]|nr:hypothetical protein [Actinomycetota bacterium]
MQMGSKGSIYVAVGITALGFLVIFFGWNGAASKDYVTGQVPYVVSGGVAGLALVLVGLSVALAEARKRDTAKLGAKLDRLLEHLGATEVDAYAEPEEHGITDRIVGFRRSRAKRAS